MPFIEDVIPELKATHVQISHSPAWACDHYINYVGE